MITTYHTVLHAKKQLTPDVWLFTFRLVEPSEIVFEAGQYLILKVPGKGSRNYSIVSRPENSQYVEMVIQLIPGGMASEYLAHVQTNEPVEFFGPGGKFVYHESPRDKLFLATGTGIAPIKSMIESYLYSSSPDDHSTKMRLFWGIKSRTGLYFIDDLRRLSDAYPHFTYTICLSRENSIADMGANFQTGRINSAVLKYLGFDHIEDAPTHHEALNRYDYYICGSRDVVESIKLFVFSLAVSREQVYFEKF